MVVSFWHLGNVASGSCLWRNISLKGRDSSERGGGEAEVRWQLKAENGLLQVDRAEGTEEGEEQKNFLSSILRQGTVLSVPLQISK